MLPPDSRQILLDILRPPVGYRLDGAIGTTFTLSFDAALVVPLAFASFRLSGTSDPVAAMEAVRSASERVDVFCQAGQMKVPSSGNSLYAFLEPMIHEVRRPRPGALFHPKVWFLRYVSEDGDAPAVRFLCLTRNLTHDTSWDLSLRLDGYELARRKKTNRPLAGFINALPDLSVAPVAAERRSRVAALAESAHRAEWEWPDGVDKDLAFWPLGIDGINARPDFTGYRHLVMAPFLNAEGIDTVAPSPDSEVTVVSRVEDLDRLEPGLIDRLDKSMVVSSAADLDDPEAPAEQLTDRGRLTGLHAKLYIVERSRLAHVFIGSANATSAAFGGNVEFLVELVTGATKMGVASFLDDEAGIGAILEPYDAVGGAEADPIEEALRQLLDVLRRFAERRLTATVRRTGDDRYVERIKGDAFDLPEGVSVTLELVSLPGSVHSQTAGVAVDAELGPVALDEVTPFIAVHATTTGPGGVELRQATVVRCTLIDDPDDRLDEILARQINTPDKFLKFLLLILGITDPAAFIGEEQNGESGSWVFGARTNGIFELLARVVGDRPEALDDLDRLVPRLRATAAGASVLPPGFDELWDAIEAARPALADLRRVEDGS